LAPENAAYYPANPPAAHRVGKQLRRLTPDNPLEDPYIAALLIALAQWQRRHHSDHNSGSPVLLATLKSRKWLYIYTSTVSASSSIGSTTPLVLRPQTRHLGSAWRSTADSLLSNPDKPQVEAAAEQAGTR